MHINAHFVWHQSASKFGLLKVGNEADVRVKVW